MYLQNLSNNIKAIHYVKKHVLLALSVLFNAVLKKFCAYSKKFSYVINIH